MSSVASLQNFDSIVGNKMVKVVLTVAWFVFTLGVTHGNAAKCPNVEKLHCIWNPGPEDKVVLQSFLTLDDGTKCPACPFGFGRDPGDLKLFCPPLACPMWFLEDHCKPKFHSLYISTKHGRTCPACDTYECL